ncbi:hypothetical protein K439DRAFT_1548373 [Ramaria rubella]|nr:hypothetical protein K439DRAFT_1548373 [Ramaria rubella]
MRFLAIVSVLFAVTQVAFATTPGSGAHSASAVASGLSRPTDQEHAIIRQLVLLHNSNKLPVSSTLSRQQSSQLSGIQSHVAVHVRTRENKSYHQLLTRNLNNPNDYAVHDVDHTVEPGPDSKVYHTFDDTASGSQRTVHYVVADSTGMVHTVDRNPPPPVLGTHAHH